MISASTFLIERLKCIFYARHAVHAYPFVIVYITI